MAGGDTVIYNFPAMDEATRKYRTASGEIVSIGSSIQSNASTLQSAVESDASNIYAEKLSTLVKNVNVAGERLSAEIAQQVEQALEEARQAETEAINEAERISSYSLD